MPDLVVVVPSRGRPASVRGLAEVFRQTCTAGTLICLAIDADDPCREQYHAAAGEFPGVFSGVVEQPAGGTMVTALNLAAGTVAPTHFAVGFMGDDHCPRTHGWDSAYLVALRDLGTGIVYGDDLIQRERLPTQCAMTAGIVLALGWMAPPTLRHLAVDDWWLALGRAAGCIRYLPEVVVEHRHPVAGTAVVDEGYLRVNDPQMYRHDLAEFRRLAAGELLVAAAKVNRLRGVPAGG